MISSLGKIAAICALLNLTVACAMESTPKNTERYHIVALVVEQKKIHSINIPKILNVLSTVSQDQLAAAVAKQNTQKHT